MMLAACHGDRAIEEIPLGPQTLTGNLTQTGVSLLRRGTHVLSIDGHARYFLESKTEDLQAFNNKTVIVTGIAAANTYAKYLPILVVSHVELTGGTAEFKEWNIPALGIAVTTPAAWKADLKGSTARFSSPDLATPFLSITRTETTALPDGVRLFQQGRIGVKIDNDTTMAEEVRFVDGSSTLQLSFEPVIQEMTSKAAYDQLKEQFTQTLLSLQFTQGNTISAIQTGSGAGLPCGGAAGILCPAGLYCAIGDMVNGIGTCVRR